MNITDKILAPVKIKLSDVECEEILNLMDLYANKMIEYDLNSLYTILTLELNEFLLLKWCDRHQNLIALKSKKSLKITQWATILEIIKKQLSFGAKDEYNAEKPNELVSRYATLIAIQQKIRESILLVKIV